MVKVKIEEATDCRAVMVRVSVGGVNSWLAARA
jgi:hypothetical protein